MPDVFISYSRHDEKFARKLHDALRHAGHEPWVDWEGIPPSSDWLGEIYMAIEATCTFLFVLSPQSVSSEICIKELEHASARGKRLITLVRRNVAAWSVPSELTRSRWIFMRKSDDFTAALDELTSALNSQAHP